MKYTRLLLAGLLLSTMPLQAGCATLAAAGQVGEVIQAANQPADTFFNTLAEEKAYYGLLRFEEVSNRLSIIAVDMGFITPGSPQATRIADLLLELTAIVEAAKQAKALNDAATVSQKVAEGKRLYDRIMDLLG